VSSADIAAARLLLARLGVTPEQLLHGRHVPPSAVPTFAQYIPVVSATVSVGTGQAYSSYWNRISER
jgi:hypothetical protein